MHIRPEDIGSGAVRALEERLAREFHDLSPLVARIAPSAWRELIKAYAFEERRLIVDEHGKRVETHLVPASEDDLFSVSRDYAQLVHPRVQEAFPTKQYSRLFVGPRRFLAALKDMGVRGYQGMFVLRVGEGPYKPLEEFRIGLNYRDAGFGVALLHAAGAGEVVLVDQEASRLSPLLAAVGVPPPRSHAHLADVVSGSLAGLVVQFDPSRRVKKEYRRALMPGARYGRLDLLG